MTTQARELAGIITNAGDLLFDDDVTLQSDGAVLNFGADSDVTLTHVADTALLLNSTRRLQFGDSGTYINQSADGVLNLTSDTEVEINATTIDINGNVDVSGTLTTAAGGIATASLADDAVTLAKMDGLARGKIIYGNASGNPTALTVGSSGQALVSDGTDISWGSGGAISTYSNSTNNRVITSVDSSSVNSEANLTFDGSTLAVTGAATISTTLAVTGVLTADAGIDVDNFNIDGTTIALSSGDMTLDAAGDIILDADGGDVYFKDAGTTNFQIKIAPASAGVELYNIVADEDLRIILNDGGSNVTALTLDASNAGQANFNAGLGIGGTAAANTLNDYEEGTWTPTLSGDGTYHQQQGRYIKIGRQVTVWYNLACNVMGTNSTTTTSGLPFAVEDIVPMNVGGNNIAYFTSLLINVVMLSAIPRKGTSTIQYSTMASAGDTTSIPTAIFKQSTDIYAMFAYTAA